MRTRALVLIVPFALTAGCATPTGSEPGATVTVSTSASSWTLYQGSPSPSPAPSGFSASGAPAPGTIASGTFLPFRPGATAISYDPAVVPPGATAQVTITTTGYGSVIRLAATGLVPRRAYGAHLHTKPCTAVPDEAGPHYQHLHDPKTPSVNPSYANPQNEVWLDFTAAADGSASAVSEERWQFDPAQPPRSLVIHAQSTRTASGVAGMAGARAACLTLPVT
jgi:Cu-Zn family superoxide dismutase